MLRKIATGVYVICLSAWLCFALLLCMTIIGHGWGAVGPKLLHLAGNTNELGVQSWRFVVWRFLGLLCITIVAWYFRRGPRRPEPSNS
jgi:uncharacterized BrkB/YihY/UPF0761 family membrane protein